MPRRVHLLWLLLTCGAGVLPAAGRAMAQSSHTSTPAAGPPTVAPATAKGESAVAERERLRAELTRVQAEIDRLKSGDRGLRTDYLLRARLADAEALARRLTEIDALLKPRVPPSPASAAAPAAREEPLASPTDGPAELEAKADILADQAHRAQTQAVALKARIDQVRGRRELHRRAHQLENDPFAPLESSRRRLVTSSSAAGLASRDAAGAGPHSPTTGSQGAPTSADSSGPPPGAAALPGVTSTSTPPTTPTPTPPSSTTPAAAAPVQVRDLLDPATTTPVRRADPGQAPGQAPGNDLESMERALAGLQARAQHLDAQARRLRAQARGH